MLIKEVHIEEDLKYLYKNGIEKELNLNAGIVYSLQMELERGWGPQDFLIAAFEDEDKNEFSFIIKENEEKLLIKKNNKTKKEITDFKEFIEEEGMDGEFNMIDLIHKLFFPQLKEVKYQSKEDYMNAPIKEEELPF